MLLPKPRMAPTPTSSSSRTLALHGGWPPHRGDGVPRPRSLPTEPRFALRPEEVSSGSLALWIARETPGHLLCRAGGDETLSRAPPARPASIDSAVGPVNRDRLRARKTASPAPLSRRGPRPCAVITHSPGRPGRALGSREADERSRRVRLSVIPPGRHAGSRWGPAPPARLAGASFHRELTLRNDYSLLLKEKRRNGKGCRRPKAPALPVQLIPGLASRCRRSGTTTTRHRRHT